MDPLADPSTLQLLVRVEDRSSSLLATVRRVLADARANPLPRTSTWRGVLLAAALGGLLGILLTLGAVQ